MRYHILLNARSGTAQDLGLTRDGLLAMLERAGHDATIDDDASAPLEDRIVAALASDAAIVVAAGGDGTVTALAGAMLDTDKALAILPLGTANLLARDLHIPLDLDQWVGTLGDMRERLIDVGEVNGRIFLHKAVIGFVPGIAAGREMIRGRQSLWANLGFLRYFFRRLWRSRRLAIEIAPANGEPRIERVQAIAVASNAYDEGFGRVFSRARLDAGILTLYILKHLDLGDLVRLVIAMLLGRWRKDDALAIESVKAVTIRSRKSTLKVMIDGEIETLGVPLEFSIRPLALKVLAPPEAPVGQETEDRPAQPAREN